MPAKKQNKTETQRKHISPEVHTRCEFVKQKAKEIISILAKRKDGWVQCEFENKKYAQAVKIWKHYANRFNIELDEINKNKNTEAVV